MVTILIADDDAGIRDALTRALTQEGFRTIAVRDGLEALAALDRQPIDLIVSDVTMPRFTGEQLLATLRQRGDARGVILMSAVVRSVRGASAVLPKPFDLDQLVAAERQAVARVRAGTEPTSDGHAH